MKNFYQILGISPKASLKEIKKRHRALAKKYHPDINPNNKEAEDIFKKNQEAYEVLSDEMKRKKFDDELYAFYAVAYQEQKENSSKPQYNYSFQSPAININWESVVGFILLVLVAIFLIPKLFPSNNKK